MKVLVNKIIPFSAVDGPGNRTAIFLQGCNFNCRYCHNPETITECIHCGICVESCPSGALTMEENEVIYQPDLCTGCDTCVKVCPYNSSPKAVEMTALEVFMQVKKQIPFIRGITVSGGECTRHPEFLQELFLRCKKEGLTTLIDTNGSLDFAQYPGLLNVTDGVMLDIKAFDPVEHLELTGQDNGQVLGNAIFLASIGKLTEIRTVIVPELFSAAEAVNQIAALLKPYLDNQSIRYKLIAYRPMGVREEYSHYKVPSEEFMQCLEQIVRNHGFQDVVLV